jgi:hypothetical protein
VFIDVLERLGTILVRPGGVERMAFGTAAAVDDENCAVDPATQFDAEAQFRERLRVQELLRYAFQASRFLCANAVLGTSNPTMALALERQKREWQRIRL